MLQRLIAYLFTPRRLAGNPTPERLFRPFPFEFLDAVVFACYAAILSWDIHHHLPWIDEAQAWLIARDDSLKDMLLRRLHYEGAPPLWHLLLKTTIALHLPYNGLNWMAGAFALAGMVVFLRCSPFPRIFRWTLPFTFYLQYQYAAVARPYVLVPFLFFTLAIVFCLPRPRPILFGLVAGFLANINAHAAILSCVFAALYLYDLKRAPGLPNPLLQRRILIGGSLFAVLCVASVATAFPAPDAMVVPTATGHIKKSNPLVRWLLPPETMPAAAPPLDPSLEAVAAVRAEQLLQAKNLPIVPPEPLTLRNRIRLKLHFMRLFTADVATFPIAESNLLALVFLAAFALWLWSRGHLRFLLPWFLATPLAAYIWIYDHHTGIFAVTFIVTAWISFEKPLQANRPPSLPPRIPPSLVPRIAPALASIALLVIVLQIHWTAHQVRMETNHPYDAGKQTQAFLAAHYAGKRIAGFSFQTVSLQPYATHNLFFNQEHTYWMWSNANPIDMRRTEALRQHPDVVVIGDLIQGQDTLYNQWGSVSLAGTRPYEEMFRFWQDHGYHETHRFCGDRYMRAGVDNTLCEATLEPN